MLWKGSTMRAIRIRFSSYLPDLLWFSSNKYFLNFLKNSSHSNPACKVFQMAINTLIHVASKLIIIRNQSFFRWQARFFSSDKQSFSKWQKNLIHVTSFSMWIFHVATITISPVGRVFPYKKKISWRFHVVSSYLKSPWKNWFLKVFRGFHVASKVFSSSKKIIFVWFARIYMWGWWRDRVSSFAVTGVTVVAEKHFQCQRSEFMIETNLWSKS